MSFLVFKLQQDIFIFLSVYFFSCFEFHVYLCSKKCLCFYLFFSDVFLLFFYSTNIANSIKRCFARNVLVFTSFLLLCFFSPFEFHEYLKLLRFQQVSCPESEVRHLSTTFQPFAKFRSSYFQYNNICISIVSLFTCS